MHHPRWRCLRPRSLPFIALLVLLVPGLAAGADQPASAHIVAHELTVRLDPPTHQVHVTDRMTVAAPPAVPRLAFTLHGTLRVVGLRAGEASDVPIPFEAQQDVPAPGVQTITISPERPAGGRLELEWQYEGVIDDPPREPKHLRFVTPSETTGHIGPEGVYLSGETHWYPDLAGSLARFDVTVTLPDGWRSVTHGRVVPGVTGVPGAASSGATERWEVTAATEALTLVANRFEKSSRRWGAIEVSTYLFPEDAALAQEYLDATIRYLELYTRLLGDYPFPKFAVVENFFASGLGMPSFTLLGSGVIKRHYVQPYALGHEIVHSWLGNWVLNDPEAGNWVEGLTTYLANYYYDEWRGRTDEAREQRRLMLLGYSLYVTPQTDYPVARFRQKTDQQDNAIGYQKAAMVFHMLRRQIGEEAFWQAVRRLVASRGGAYTTWQDLEQIFSVSAGRDLGWFFSQWVTRAGAPSLAIVDAEFEPGDTGGRLRLRLAQANEPYRLEVPLALETDSGLQRISVSLERQEQVVELPVETRPRRVRLDPEYEVFRRLDRAKLPPMLNLFVTDPRRTVVLPRLGAGEAAEQDPYGGLATRLRAQGGDHQAAITVFSADEWPAQGKGSVPAGSVMVLGGPDRNPAARWVEQVCRERVRLQPGRIEVNGERYEGEHVAVLVSCRRSEQPGSVVTLFAGTTAKAARQAARLLFFYGWQSYLVFRDGQVVTRGDFPEVIEEREVRSAR